MSDRRRETGVMARTLVVYESMFGNTRAVAGAIAEGAGAAGPVELVEVGAAPTTLPDDVDLLVVGAPTHAFGMSRPSTRKSASEQSETPLVSAGIGVREWLDGLVPRPGVRACAFDTRVRVPGLPGSAAKAIARRLRSLGFTVQARQASFWVAGSPGPLRDGELSRARAWGADITAGHRV